nr:ABC transporter substrate-binding protein [Elstera litoralis]
MRSPLRQRAAQAGAGLLIAFGLMASAHAADPVRVGSKLDAEATLLGNLIQQTLEANGIKTVNKLQLGPTKITRGALLAGEIDIYPEYTGNAAFFHSQDSDPVWKKSAEGYERARNLDEKNKLVWLPSAPANNTWAIALRQDVAGPNKLTTLEEFGAWVAKGGVVKLAGSAEFVESPAALPAFQTAYGFTLKPDQLLVLAGGDTAVTLRAAGEKTSGVNAAMAYGTDAAISALGLVALEDNKGAQIVYEPAPVVRAEVLAAYPAIRTSLAPVFASLNADTLRALNAKIAIEGQDAKQVAAAYLAEKGFVKK